MIFCILGNPGVTHSVPTAFINECSGYGMDHTWVTEDGDFGNYHSAEQGRLGQVTRAYIQSMDDNENSEFF